MDASDDDGNNGAPPPEAAAADSATSASGSGSDDDNDDGDNDDDDAGCVRGSFVLGVFFLAFRHCCCFFFISLIVEYPHKTRYFSFSPSPASPDVFVEDEPADQLIVSESFAEDVADGLVSKWPDDYARTPRTVLLTQVRITVAEDAGVTSLAKVAEEALAGKFSTGDSDSNEDNGDDEVEDNDGDPHAPIEQEPPKPRFESPTSGNALSKSLQKAYNSRGAKRQRTSDAQPQQQRWSARRAAAC
jgi:hypothetical protein